MQPSRPEQRRIWFAWSGPCPVRLEGPFLVSGTDYVGVIECYSAFTLRESLRIREAA
jgi:hypothetical protein